MEILQIYRPNFMVATFTWVLLLGCAQFAFMFFELRRIRASVDQNMEIQQSLQERSANLFANNRAAMRKKDTYPTTKEIDTGEITSYPFSGEYFMESTEIDRLVRGGLFPQNDQIYSSTDGFNSKSSEVSTEIGSSSSAQTLYPSTEETLSSEEEQSADNDFHIRAKKRFAEDAAVRMNTFLSRSVCSEGNVSSPVPLGHSCALKLTVSKLAENSRSFSYLSDRLERDRREMSEVQESRIDAAKKKRVMFWEQDERDRSQYMSHCPACEFVANAKVTNPEAIDAIIINSFVLQKVGGNSAVPSRSMYPNAKMIVYENEPTQRSGSFLLEGLVDYTYGYRRDSDVAKAYGHIKPRDEPADISELLASNSRKTKTVLWMVSYCEAPSMRFQLVKTLQSYGVTIDIYGRCGPFKCPKKNSSCTDVLAPQYKFYLAFENTLCNHYVTEKFYRTLSFNMVPITYGLGHELTGAPRDSYIDVFDFADAKSLAEYILYLDSNVTAYNEYFKWREFYDVENRARPDLKLCQLCKILVEDTPPLRKFEAGEFEVWLKDGQCIDLQNNTRILNFVFGVPQL